MLSGRGDEHQANIHSTLKDGFVEVTADELDAFRAETKIAQDAGWKPSGRVEYSKFLERHPELVGSRPA